MKEISNCSLIHSLRQRVIPSEDEKGDWQEETGKRRERIKDNLESVDRREDVLLGKVTSKFWISLNAIHVWMGEEEVKTK